MKIECAIFDFDGTLFDSMFIWENAGEMYLRSLGIEPTPSMREDIRTLSLYQSAVYFQQVYEISQSVEQIMSGINETIEHFYINDVLPKQGVIEFLDKMKSFNIPMCIASASDRYQIEAALNRCNMNHYFDAIFTCSEIGYGKDEPYIFRQAIQYFNASRNSTIVFEDAFHAIQSAKSDDFTVVAVYDESEKRQKEIKKLADCYILEFKKTEDFWKFIEKGE